MSEGEKSSFWNLGSRQSAPVVPPANAAAPVVASNPVAAPVSREDDSSVIEVAAKSKADKPSAQYDVVQIAPAERFNLMFRGGQKTRLSCWVMLRHKTTGEIILTGAISRPGDGGVMVLAIDMKDVDRFSAM